MKKITTLLALAAMTGAASAAGIIIDSTIGNGGFVNAATNFNATTEVSGWTATNGVWVDAGNTNLSTAPFGVDTATESHFLQIHNDGGETVLSDSFALVAGEGINFSVDAKNGGTVTVDLFDGVNSIALGDVTGGAGATWVQTDSNAATVAISGNYQLRFTLAGGSATDTHIDRVFLETTAVPEPSSSALLGLGGLALLLRRRK